MHANQVFAFITDFGRKDGYVGMLKAVILKNINNNEFANVKFIDISHEIERGNLFSGMFILERAYSFFPNGTIFIAVIDPGVGSARAGIVVFYNGYIFVGPDNGLLTPFLNNGEVFLIDYSLFKKQGVSFDGRDVFAITAARLSMGDKKMLKSFYSPYLIEISRPTISDESIVGEIVYIDIFGNLISNISGDLVQKGYILFKDTRIPVVNAYSDVQKGMPLALVDGFNRLEIAINMGDASEIFHCKTGEKIEYIRSSI